MSFRFFKWAAVAALMLLSATASFADTMYILNASRGGPVFGCGGCGT
jgi:hypothetical protein